MTGVLRTLRADLLKHIVLILIVLCTYYPLFFILSNSLKNNDQFAANIFDVPWPMHLDNYTAAWPSINGFILNSLIVAAASVVATLVCGAMAAYVLARFRFRGREFIFLLYVGLLLVPFVLTLIPLYLEMKTLHLIDSWWALILPYAAGGQVLTVFVLRSFFGGLPEELFEAGRIDGAGEFQLFLRLAVPLSLAPLGAVAIITSLNIWGDYLWPTIVLPTAAKYTMSAGAAYFTSQFGLVSQTGQVFAVYMMSTLPVVALVVLTMRTYVNGLTQGALKL